MYIHHHVSVSFVLCKANPCMVLGPEADIQPLQMSHRSGLWPLSTNLKQTSQGQPVQCTMQLALPPMWFTWTASWICRLGDVLACNCEANCEACEASPLWESSSTVFRFKWQSNKVSGGFSCPLDRCLSSSLAQICTQNQMFANKLLHLHHA